MSSQLYLMGGTSVFTANKPSYKSNRTPQEKAFYATIDRLREGRCRVYWGCHGCDILQGIPHVVHRCWCGRRTHGYSVLWGEDVTEVEELRNPDAAKRQSRIEQDKERMLRAKYGEDTEVMENV